MNHLLVSTLVKTLLPLIAVALMLFVAHKRGLSFKNDLGLQAPTASHAAVSIGLWLLLVVLEEWINWRLGGAQPRLWPTLPTYIIFLRILAIGVAGPVVEELVFRGLLLGLFKRTRLGPWGAVLVSAILWSALHTQYEPAVLAWIFVDGLALGLARVYTRSVYVPLTMHIIGNMYSIYQSLG